MAVKSHNALTDKINAKFNDEGRIPGFCLTRYALNKKTTEVEIIEIIQNGYATYVSQPGNNRRARGWSAPSTLQLGKRS